MVYDREDYGLLQAKRSAEAKGGLVGSLRLSSPC